MPETRKHQVIVRDALDKAIYDAIGEPVRPVEPGQKISAATPVPDLPAATELGTFGGRFVIVPESPAEQ
ncbi:MAG: hypothetical protein ACRCWS_03000 [Propionibacteriaceae bacterium]